MTGKRIILRSIAHLLCGVIVYMHVCSAWCAVFSGGCCSEGKDQNLRSACQHEKNSTHQSGDCQDYHLSFFNAAGQFASEKNVDVVKVFPIGIAEVPNLIFTKPVNSGENLFAFNNFHPPPPIEDIRVFIRSFQI